MRYTSCISVKLPFDFELFINSMLSQSLFFRLLLPYKESASIQLPWSSCVLPHYDFKQLTDCPVKLWNFTVSHSGQYVEHVKFNATSYIGILLLTMFWGNRTLFRTNFGLVILSRCCDTNRKVAGSIPAGVIGIFHWNKILPIALWP